MTVKRILYWKPNRGSAIDGHTVNRMAECVRSLNGEEKETLRTEVTHYEPILRDQSMRAEFPRHTLGFYPLGQPNRYYFVIFHHTLVVEADPSILTIMNNLRSYRPYVFYHFEGVQYKLGDFQIKLVKVFERDNILKGILMEIEYLPISSIEIANPIIQEFIEIWQGVVSTRELPGEFVEIELNFAAYGLADRYTWQHTAVQYVNALIELIHSVGFR